MLSLFRFWLLMDLSFFNKLISVAVVRLFAMYTIRAQKLEYITHHVGLRSSLGENVGKKILSSFIKVLYLIRTGLGDGVSKPLKKSRLFDFKMYHNFDQ